MDRFPCNIARWGGNLLSAIGEWTSRGPVNDLTAVAGGEAYIAPSTLESGRRLLLHRGPVTFPDHGVQAIIDRFKPARAAGEALGLVVAWRVSGCDPDAGLLDLPADSDDPSGVLNQFVCQPVEDPALGEDNHVRLEVDRAELRIIERIAGIERSLFAMDLPGYVRRLAIRAEHIEGAVTVWWNPDGYEEFPDAPLARVHTLIDGESRPGIFSHRDGRFLAVRVDYRCEVEASAPSLVSADRPEMSLRPLRINLQVDESRPPILSGYCISHEGDTLLPEAQHMESRVALRNVRLAARPGQLYRVDGHVRTVDGDLVRVRRSTVSLEGEAEDLRLRDSQGRLVLFSWEDAPAGETRSDLKILEWPRELVTTYPLSTVCNASDVDAVTTEFHDSVRRGVRRSFRGRRTWTLDLSALDATTSLQLPAFFNEAKAQTSPILWSHPLTDEHVILRFANAELPVRGVENRAYSANFDLTEDPQFLDAAPSTPGSGGGGDSDSGGDGGTGGETCPAADGAIEPMFMNPGGDRVLDRDPDRPAFRAANLQMPERVRFTFRGGEISKDPDHSHVGALGELIAVLTEREWTLEHVGRSSGTSRHWHHARFGGTLPSIGWSMPNDGVSVTRDLWRASRTYAVGGDTHELELRFVAEFHAADPDDNAALGTVFHLFAFSSQVNPSYVDGTPWDFGTGTNPSFTREDPAIFGIYADAGAHRKLCHPQMVLCASLPTTFESPIGHAWYSGNVPSEDQVPGDPDRDALANARASCSARECGSPWSVPDPGPDLGEYFPPRGLTFAGSAGTSPSQLTLCPTGLAPTRGACWYAMSQQDVRAGMTTTFAFLIDGVTGAGGAGLAFVIQNDDERALGGEGRGMGYGYDGTNTGIANSIAVEFDTHDDSPSIADMPAGHVSVQTRGTLGNDPSHLYSLGAAGGFTFTDGLWHTARIEITTASPPHLKLWVDGVSALDVAIDLDGSIGVSPAKAWVGFTAANGPGSQRVRVGDWKLRTGAAPTFGDPDEALDNSVFGYGNVPYGYATMSLGGGQPTSAPMEWVTVEDIAGLTALRAAFPGWDVDRGGIIWRASVTCAICTPDQIPIDGCDGTPGALDAGTLACMVFPPDAAEPCCEPVISRLDVALVQLREDESFTFDAGGSITAHDDFIAQIYTRTIGMFIDEVSFAEGQTEDNRYMEWRFNQRNPDYVRRDLSLDTFPGPALAGWVASGNWAWDAGAAKVVNTPSTFDVLYKDFAAPTDQLADGTIRVKIAGGASAVHVLAARAATGTNNAYLAVLDRAFQVLQLWLVTDDGFGGMVVKVLNSVPGVTAANGDALVMTLRGSSISASAGGFALDASDCTHTAGVWGPAATAGSLDAAYDDAQITDDTAELVTAHGRLDHSGWHLVVPPEIMPGYADRAGCTGCGDCIGPFVSCTATQVVALHPPQINSNQGGSLTEINALEVPIGTGAPWGGPRCGHPTPPGDCECLFDDFVSAACTLYDGPFEGVTPMCPDVESSACRRFNIWTGYICAGE